MHEIAIAKDLEQSVIGGQLISDASGHGQLINSASGHFNANTAEVVKSTNPHHPLDATPSSMGYNHMGPTILTHQVRRNDTNEGSEQNRMGGPNIVGPERWFQQEGEHRSHGTGSFIEAQLSFTALRIVTWSAR